MRIGIFTDTYMPSTNGIVYVTKILRRTFEARGHEVFIFAPSTRLSTKQRGDDGHIIRFPAVRSFMHEDFYLSLFSRSRALDHISELNLDVIHFLTPGLVGMLGVYAGRKLGKPVVAEYCTDLFDYVEHYPMTRVALLSIGLLFPSSVKATREELLDLLKAARPRRGVSTWNKEMTKHLVTAIHTHCDAVIAHSRKSAEQMLSWQDEDEHYPIELIPTGVDALPAANQREQAAFRKKWKLQPEDEVVLYIGRLGPEKNLAMLIDMITELVKSRPNAKLMYVGDFPAYRPELEALAKASPAAAHIVFTGRIPREKLGQPLSNAQVFVFPSLTDTQGLVVHEAAQAGLPIVMVDEPVTEVVRDGQNGYFCRNDPAEMAAKIAAILASPQTRTRMSTASRTIAGEFTEQRQSDKILAIYRKILGR